MRKFRVHFLSWKYFLFLVIKICIHFELLTKKWKIVIEEYERLARDNNFEIFIVLIKLEEILIKYTRLVK